MRKTKIVATIGPASSSEERLEALIRAGMDVARLNFSHGTHEQHAAAFTAIRAVSARLGRAVAILQDLSGPKIRTGALAGGKPVLLVDGAEVTITTEPVVGTASLLATTYPHLADDLHPGDRVLLADGLMELTVLSSQAGLVRCRVVHGGLLGEHKGINLPGVRLSAPAVTEKDADDLAFGVSLGVDYLAVSFVRQAEDLRQVRHLLREHGADTPVIAKIEKPEAVKNLDAILGACEGVMVARGDLGVEVSPEKVPMLQKQIIEAANRHGDLVITATQMLESMVSNPRPTRAEASDVANAILDGTDAVMLSAETAVGQYPVEAVDMMSRIALEAEASGRAAGPTDHSRRGYAHAIAHAACTIAGDLDFKAAEMNDVLKSLTIEERGGGKVSGVRYDSSEPVDRKLREFPFTIGGAPSLAALLDQLKGSRIELRFGPVIMVVVRMVLEGQLAEGLSNFLIRGICIDAKHFVVVSFHCHSFALIIAQKRIGSIGEGERDKERGGKSPLFLYVLFSPSLVKGRVRGWI